MTQEILTTTENILTSQNGTSILLTIIVLALVFLILVKTGLIKIRTKYMHIGTETRIAAENEREIVRRQASFARIFISSLEGKINADTSEYNGYFTKYILERVYDEVIEWIHFNHLCNDEKYISVKEKMLCALVYSLGVKPEFKTPEFERRMCAWTREIISELVNIRETYKLTLGGKDA